MDLCPVEYTVCDRFELQHMASPLTPDIQVVNLQLVASIVSHFVLMNGQMGVHRPSKLKTWVLKIAQKV